MLVEQIHQSAMCENVRKCSVQVRQNINPLNALNFAWSLNGQVAQCLWPLQDNLYYIFNNNKSCFILCIFPKRTINCYEDLPHLNSFYARSCKCLFVYKKINNCPTWEFTVMRVSTIWRRPCYFVENLELNENTIYYHQLTQPEWLPSSLLSLGLSSLGVSVVGSACKNWRRKS